MLLCIGPNPGELCCKETNLKTKLLFLALAMVLVVPASLMADSIPYGNIGTQAPVNVFTATSTGPLTAYFFTSDAGYTSNIGMLINDVSTGVFGLNNHLSSHGDSVVLGNVNAGDTIEFQLYVYDLG